MPEVAEARGLTFIKGPGLDHVIEEKGIKRIVVLDPYFGDIYGDYLFAGYEVVEEFPKATLPDVVGFHTAAVLLSKKPAVVVCGFDPLRCAVALAAYLIKEEKVSVEEAVEEAEERLSSLYGAARVPRVPKRGLEAYARLASLFGDYLDAIMALGLNYEFGKGGLHWGEAVTWANSMEYDDPLFLATALHFLAEGHGKRDEVFQRRLEVVRREALEEMLGEEGLEALELVREFAEGKLRELEFVEALQPGEGYVRDVERRGDEVVVRCIGCEAVKGLNELLPLERAGVRKVSFERVTV
ncbi:hypothetical protein Igni_0940 [Ignicoccus hospitalis KIN4/I]|uniref:Uncharacterized protein n=1 Tax=Ignicoccus hospitalis (strain KIN4/I / DSM 18386 / JCM 14125) TaxID=453591 RepID=A8AB18_IGNH4|nr:hypothetical protein Igni_0940 [Ignicoccus hospitalis KIN4/I]